MNLAPPQSATELARLTGQSRFAIHRAVADVIPAGNTTREGNRAKAWHLADLPETVRRLADPAALRDLASVLAAHVQRWPRGGRPTRNQVAEFFDAAFLHLGRLADAGADQEHLRAWLLDWMRTNTPAGTVSQSLAGIRKKFDRYLAKWVAGGRKPTALKPGWQAAACERRKPALPKDESDLLIENAIARQKNGSLRAAWSACWPELSEPSRIAYPARTSVPRKVYQQLGPEIRNLWDWYHRPRFAELNGACIRQDHSLYFAGDIYSADDLTLEIYYYVEDGNGWFQLIRGQFLVMIDVRSKRILDFILIDERGYKSADVRRLVTAVCEEHKLPRVGFHFEGGSWNARMTGGGARVDLYEDRRETFAERLSLRIITALPGNARAKIIENVNGLLQRLMPGELGYVGPNEQTIKFERIQAAKAAVARGERTRTHPAQAGFRSEEEWFQRLHEIADTYNTTPQDSRVMGGNQVVRMTPNEAWEKCQPRDAAGNVLPMTPVTADNRHLVACHKEVKTVTRDGIQIDGHRYIHEATGEFLGREVVVWYDPDQPEAIHVEDPDSQAMRTVALSPDSPAFVATSDQIRAAKEGPAAHNRVLKRRVSQLRKTFEPPQRTVIASPSIKRKVAQMAEGRETIRHAERETQRRQRAATRLQQQGLNVDPDAFANLPPEVRDLMLQAEGVQ
jgi:hypothetical protein